MTKPLSNYTEIAELVKSWADKIDSTGPGIEWQTVSELADEMRAYSNKLVAQDNYIRYCPWCGATKTQRAGGARHKTWCPRYMPPMIPEDV